VTEEEARNKAERWDKLYVLARLADGDDPLRLSIEHWRDNVALLEAASRPSPMGIYSGAYACALCHTYWYTQSAEDRCQGCPLEEAGIGCLDNEGSPYNQWEQSETLEEELAAARALLKALEGLVETTELRCEGDSHVWPTPDGLPEHGDM